MRHPPESLSHGKVGSVTAITTYELQARRHVAVADSVSVTGVRDNLWVVKHFDWRQFYRDGCGEGGAVACSTILHGQMKLSVAALTYFQ